MVNDADVEVRLIACRQFVQIEGNPLDDGLKE